MKSDMKTFELNISRMIPATPAEVFDGWLDPTCPGSPWGGAEKLILDAKVDGLYYWLFVNTAGQRKPHYGLFTILDRPCKIQYTWISAHTHGLESLVTLTFTAQGNNTLLTLHHGNLPDDEQGRGHEKGWEFLAEKFAASFGHGRVPR